MAKKNNNYWNAEFDKKGNKLNKTQKKALFDLVSADRMNLLEKKEEREYYVERLDNLNIPLATQNKAIYLSDKYPNKYINDVVDETTKNN